MVKLSCLKFVVWNIIKTLTNECPSLTLILKSLFKKDLDLPLYICFTNYSFEGPWSLLAKFQFGQGAPAKSESTWTYFFLSKVVSKSTNHSGLCFSFLPWKEKMFKLKGSFAEQKKPIFHPPWMANVYFSRPRWFLL